VNNDFTFKTGPPHFSASKLYQSNFTEKKQYFAYGYSDEAVDHSEVVVSRGQAGVHSLLIFFSCEMWELIRCGGGKRRLGA